MLKLSPRIQMAADMVRRGRTVCDVGTDHAYLPSYLILNGISPRAVAGDIGEGPLKNAEKSVKIYGVEENVKLRLSDGLDNIGEDEADEIIICGMGGNLIADILSRAEWLRNPDKHIIAQPMSHAEDVRRFLCENGFEIEEERVCEDDGRLYLALSAYYTGEKKEYSPGFYYRGLLLKNGDALSKKYFEKHYTRVKKRIAGIEGKDAFLEEYTALKAAADDIEKEFENAES